MKSSASLCLLFATTLLFAGCNTPTSTSATASPTAPAASTPAVKEQSKNLRKGMTEVEIRSIWGAPKSVHTSPEGDTILVYQFDVLTAQKMVPTDMKEIPTYDPITGAAIVVKEPVFSPQNVTVYQTIVLQLKNGALASWARQLGEQRAFN
ncbi:MAG: hypothetical protein QG602_2379 [Verrucomicrobiota bacterium]|nr:hypothetical protein [Verrucomicrobiota bacterium]